MSCFRGGKLTSLDALLRFFRLAHKQECTLQPIFLNSGPGFSSSLVHRPERTILLSRLQRRRAVVVAKCAMQTACGRSFSATTASSLSRFVLPRTLRGQKSSPSKPSSGNFALGGRVGRGRSLERACQWSAEASGSFGLRAFKAAET